MKVTFTPDKQVIFNFIGFLAENYSDVKFDALQSLQEVFDEWARRNDSGSGITNATWWMYKNGASVLKYMDSIPKEFAKGIQLSPGELINIKLDGYKSIGVNAFASVDAIKTVQLSNIEKVEASAFKDCENITDVKIENIAELGRFMFARCKSLTNVLMVNVERINEGAFADCASLTKLVLPNSLKWIDPRFVRNSSNVEIVFDGTEQEWENVDGSSSITREIKFLR